ncbi:2-oxoglutarate dehydrogenase E1 component [Marininema halotolerans]|uniref:2-oxoglutarate dehydrogenase E1 component n=1 Tax=Marininema halotolerans TaxID=1155944 RepID=A0A1I6S019_9BACL|nr:2-oxoglutarate dehydrogenase E1 component [Marininema halotolerans]SFS70335.1 2-oxoglutarate dehydrogenase E1 component [Marininema halotolerans]
MAVESGNPWQRFHGPNLGYAQEMYEKYLEDPASVEKPMQEWFQTYGAPPGMGEDSREPVTGLSPAAEMIGNASYLQKVVATEKLVNSIRIHGHMGAKLDPLDYHQPDTRLLQPEAFGLTNEDLEMIPAEVILTDPPKGLKTAKDVVCHLRDLYTRTIAFQFSHVHDPIEREWLYKRVESGLIPPVMAKKKAEVLKQLIAVEEFEKFLHRTFVGQKRFSVEGLDMLVPLMDEIIHCSVNSGVRSINIGMAHRGRLNVLAHILGKPYAAIFSEFHHAPNKDLVPSEGSMGINSGYTGDVKYHLGADRTVDTDKVSARVALANNPSHLEYVNPVVEGFTRAAQEDRDTRGYPDQDVSRALAILVHGDAAFPGEGVVAETLNFDRLPAYQTGGSIHIIANNLLGFTTDSSDSRSTRYASDLAKGYEIPIVHVNADDPEACLAAVRLACEYRTKFQKDFLIDLIGYRRFGHNEMDDPAATQPLLYKKVTNHPTLRTSYAKTLITDGVMTEEEVKEADNEVLKQLQEAYKIAKEKRKNGNGDAKAPQLIGEVKTGVKLDVLREINGELLKRPDEFQSYPKLEKVLQRRKNTLDGEGAIDWPLAESLAIASILADGTPIRFTGQDSERGTFAQRHLVLHDRETGKKFCPLHQLPQAKASFALYNSPLTEAAVIGFEYGYNVYSPETLVIWEAQFGDFANAGQVIMDQFISAGRAKWGQLSSMVMLLPHGYEGQGPEHSSGRLERFLQMAAENNWTVANVTNAAQYFHLLRRQAAIVNTEDARPLILMTPKSLLRNKRTIVQGTALEKDSFQFVMEQPWKTKASDVKRLILASGKVAVDLEEMAEKEGKADDVQVLRVEQLYPFPDKEIKAVLKKYSQAKDLVWVQEEPRNMGAWTYMESRIRAIAPRGAKVNYIGRPDRSSTAEGKPDVHEAEQKRILREALKI